MTDAALRIVKTLLFRTVCLGDVERYFSLKGRSMLTAARLGLYERGCMRLLPAFVRPGAVAVDAGANFGVYTHALARLVGPSGRVVAFEPLPPVRAFLERSCAGLPRVTIVGEALSNARSRVELRVPSLRGGVPEPSLAHITPRSPATPWKTFDVATSRLDDHLETIDGVSFIKADLEGHETEFLEGAARTLETFRPAVQVEAAGIARQLDTLANWTRRHDYGLFALDHGRLRRDPDPARLPLNVYLLPSEIRNALPSSILASGGRPR